MLKDIPLTHPDRLRAIYDAHFADLSGRGYRVTSSRYNVDSLSGHLVVQDDDMQIQLTIHNDELDVSAAPAGEANEAYIDIKRVIAFLHPKPVDYAAWEAAAAAARNASPNTDWPAKWRDLAELLERHHDELVAFFAESGFAQRRAELKKTEAERNAEFMRQRKAFLDAKRSAGRD